MRERLATLVTNTTPLIALTAATGSLDVLNFLFARVVVPLEVADEVRVGGKSAFGLDVFENASWLDVQEQAVVLPPLLRNSLDLGEASVIQTAINLALPLVCIDELVGRRVARLCGLDLTGSVGVLLKAKQLGYAVSIPESLERMRAHGIWISDKVVRFATTRC